MKPAMHCAVILGLLVLPMIGGLACSKEEGHTSTSDDTTAKKAVAAAPKDVVDTAVAAGSFKTLAIALTAGGLVETLKGEGPFTVFAPTDEAFAKLPAGTLDDLLKPENKDTLSAILTYHVVPGKVMAKDVVSLSSAKTVNGQDLKIATRDGKVMVDNATVTKTDIDCSNGVIHVIDAVLMPK
jgi:transforming growth factor-beta-induced protein